MNDNDVRTRLDTLIGERGGDYASLSRLLGRNPAYVQQFIRRGIPRRLSEADRRVLAQHFGVSEHALGAPLPLPAVAPLPEPNAGLVLVPYLDIDASAGPGNDPGPEEPTAAIGFERSFVRALARGPVAALSAIRVDGDSMYPTLSDGDDILVDTGDSAPIRDGIYVLRSEGLLLVKRLALNPATRRVKVISDNAAYPSYDDLDPAAIDVVGRVVWVGRRLG